MHFFFFSSANSVQESQLARKIVYRWDDGIVEIFILLYRVQLISFTGFIFWFFKIILTASNEVRQVYKQFIGAVVELMGGEVVSEEFQEVALSVYKLFCTQLEDVEDDQVDKIIAEKK